MGGNHLIRRGLAVRGYPGSANEWNRWHRVAATGRRGQKSDLVTGLKCNNSAGMETSSDTLKLKIPEFVHPSFLQISAHQNQEWADYRRLKNCVRLVSFPPKRKKLIENSSQGS